MQPLAVALTWEQVVIDAHDAVALGPWWVTALGWVVVSDGEPWVVLADPEGNEFCVLGGRQ